MLSPAPRRPRVAVLRAAAGLTAVLVLALAPTLAAAHAHRFPRPRRRTRCAGAHAWLGHVPRAATERATLCLLNLQRARFHLPRLHESTKLETSAQRWTREMVDDGDFSHGTDFGARISATGFRWSQIGENIAYGFRTPAQTVTAWMHSRGHCVNILSPEFRDVGTGFARASVDGRRSSVGTWTLDLALPMGDRAPSSRFGPAAGCPY